METGYLLIHKGSDEVHVDLITEEHYNKIAAVLKMADMSNPKHQILIEEAAWNTKPIQSWFTQTYCEEPWPYNGVAIMGTISIPRC